MNTLKYLNLTHFGKSEYKYVDYNTNNTNQFVSIETSLNCNIKHI